MSTRANQVLITLGALVAAFGTVFCYVLLGRKVEDSFGGALRADGTLLTPAAPAFAIWAVLGPAVAGFVAWQWVGDHASRPRIRAASVPAALAMLFSGVWLMVIQLNRTQATGIWLSVAVALVIELNLGLAVRRLDSDVPADRLEAVLADGTFGVYFGWVTVALVANVSAAVVAQGVPAEAPPAQVLALVAISLAAVAGIAFSVRFGGRLCLALGLAWGLAWIGIGRLTSDLRSPMVGGFALAAAALVAVAAVGVRVVRRESEPVVRTAPVNE